MKKTKPNTLVIKVKNNNVQGKAKTTKPKLAELCTSETRLAKDEMNTCFSNVNDSLERKQFQDKEG